MQKHIELALALYGDDLDATLESVLEGRGLLPPGDLLVPDLGDADRIS
jgi:hypothetical protein